MTVFSVTALTVVVMWLLFFIIVIYCPAFSNSSKLGSITLMLPFPRRKQTEYIDLMYIYYTKICIYAYIYIYILYIQQRELQEPSNQISTEKKKKSRSS